MILYTSYVPKYKTHWEFKMSYISDGGNHTLSHKFKSNIETRYKRKGHIYVAYITGELSVELKQLPDLHD
jgi:hypothetical protein